MIENTARLVGAALGLLALVGPASAAELVMFRRAGCPYCLAFDRAIGPIYPRTELAHIAPLRMVDLDAADAAPPVALARPVRYTPTFVLVEEGREVARIEGYPGEDFFWGLLEKAVRTLPRRD